MKPIEFVIYDGDSNPNDPVYKIAEAMGKDIKILVSDGREYEIVGYYLGSGGNMTLEIEIVK